MMRQILLIILSLSILIACGDEVLTVDQQFEEISTTKYYNTDPIDSEFKGLNGDWLVTGTSGGFAGNGYEEDFEMLKIKPNGIFGIIRNDSIIATGKITILDDEDIIYTIALEPEEDPVEVKIQLLFDPEKIVMLNGDKLELNSPCCDRFNTHFERV